jgi:hypothetical protein
MPQRQLLQGAVTFCGTEATIGHRKKLTCANSALPCWREIDVDVLFLSKRDQLF